MTPITDIFVLPEPLSNGGTEGPVGRLHENSISTSGEPLERRSFVLQVIQRLGSLEYRISC